jgi:signal transduction histidine kinase
MIDPTLKNANILIVDDHKANIEVLADFLEIQGYQNVKSTTDPREVVNLFVSFQPDLILLDLSMPFMTGYDVMNQLKMMIAPQTYFPILVLTADISPDARQRALSSGAYDLLTKPFHLLEVGLRINNLLFTSYLQQQLKDQNLVLEQRVKERTVELENKHTELKSAWEKAASGDRLKSAFLANISHEIRTPLNGLLGFATLLSGLNEPAAERQLYVEMMNVSGERLMKTINDYIDMSKIVSGNLELIKTEVNIIDVLHESINEFQPICDEKKLRLNLLIPHEQRELFVQSNFQLLSKVIGQLIDNAIKFTIKGAVSIGLSVSPKAVEIFVKDTGIGIDIKSQQGIFEAFVQEDMSNTRIYEGSGLGLSITNGILKQLGGQIRFESLKNEGSTFYVTLPI